jgi:hypothetical protein
VTVVTRAMLGTGQTGASNREAIMAKLKITATPSSGLKRYKLAIDRKKVKMLADNTGTHNLPNNSCDDGSEHRLSYTLFGPAGAKLSVKVVCDEETEVEINDIEVEEMGEPLAGGWRDFTL